MPNGVKDRIILSYPRDRPFPPCTGDVVFVARNDTRGQLSTLGQRVLQGSILGSEPEVLPIDATHVGLVLGGTSVIHAMKGHGVSVIELRRLIEAEVIGGWKVYRSLALEDAEREDESRHLEIRGLAEYYLEQQYLFKMSKAEESRPERVFCSELVARVYRDLDIPFRAKTVNPLPRELLAEVVERSDWIDVTAVYERCLEDGSLDFGKELVLDPLIKYRFQKELKDLNTRLRSMGLQGTPLPWKYWDDEGE